MGPGNHKINLAAAVAITATLTAAPSVADARMSNSGPTPVLPSLGSGALPDHMFEPVRELSFSTQAQQKIPFSDSTAMLNGFAKVLGLPSSDGLSVVGSSPDLEPGSMMYQLAQTVSGIPVVGGADIVVRLNSQGMPTDVSGDLVDPKGFNVTPSDGVFESASRTALKYVEHREKVSGLRASNPDLVILISHGNEFKQAHLACQVHVLDGRLLHSTVSVDAHTGQVLDSVPAGRSGVGVAPTQDRGFTFSDPLAHFNFPSHPDDGNH